jgi:hypothetical protein
MSGRSSDPAVIDDMVADRVDMSIPSALVGPIPEAPRYNVLAMTLSWLAVLTGLFYLFCR